MKDKSRFISSVIVSLLAGFIYYQFGHGIEENLQSSIKAVLSSNDMEQYLSTDCKPFNTISNKSDSKLNKKKSKYFIKKRNVIEFKTKNETIPGDELFSSYISQIQAKFQKSTPDKYIDFSAELEQLIINDNSKTELRQSKEFKIDKGTDNSLADSRKLSSAPQRIQKNFESKLGVYGNGFEYNYVFVKEGNKTNTKIKKKKSESDRTNFNYNESFVPFQSYETYKNNESYRNRVENKVKVIAPKVHKKECGKNVNKDMESKQPEIIIPFMNGNDEDM